MLLRARVRARASALTWGRRRYYGYTYYGYTYYGCSDLGPSALRVHSVGVALRPRLLGATSLGVGVGVGLGLGVGLGFGLG